ncbi:MAG: VCBS repeat-containing protein [Planctomycetota bacterium]
MVNRRAARRAVALVVVALPALGHRLTAQGAALPSTSGPLFAELETLGLPGVDEGTWSLAVGDVDRDGDVDLVAAHDAKDRLYINRGDGSFVDETPQRIPPLPPPGLFPVLATTLGDLDGDADLDLVVLSTRAPAVRLLLNDGAGFYDDAAASRFASPPDPAMAIAVGDIDGDGDLDLFFATFLGNSNQLYLNDGAGSFTDASTTHLPGPSSGTDAVAFGDVDADGDLDLLLAQGAYSGFARDLLYVNDGAGHFADVTSTQMPTRAEWSSSLSVGDVDADGDLDVVFGTRVAVYGTRGQNRLYLNDGRGHFADATVTHMPGGIYATSAVRLGDLDADGDLDLVLANDGLGTTYSGEQNLAYLNDGSGRFFDATGTSLPSKAGITKALALADLDGDRDLDVIFANSARSAYISRALENDVLLNDGAGHFQSLPVHFPRLPSGSSPSIAVGDLVLRVGSSSHMSTALCAARGVASPRLVHQQALRRQRLASGTHGSPTYATNFRHTTLDGDGDGDLVTRTLLIQQEAGNFVDEGPSRLPPGPSLAGSVVGDVDGDGDLDIVGGRLLVNDGLGFFTSRTLTRLPAGTTGSASATLGDVDGDGDLDLLRGHQGQNQLFLNNAGRFTRVTTTHLPMRNSTTNSVAMGDVDGDGDLDFVTANGVIAYASPAYPSGRPNHLYINDGTGRFTDAAPNQLPSEVNASFGAALADLDGDGDLDLVFAECDRNRRLFNDGSGNFTDTTGPAWPALNHCATSIATGDFDADGDVDLVFANGGYAIRERNRLYLNDGRGGFVDATATDLPGADNVTDGVAASDLDGDGDLDLVFANRRNTNRLYLNLTRHLDTTRARLGQPFHLDIYARRGPQRLFDVAVPMVAAGPAQVPLPPWGTLGLDPTQLITLPPVLLPPGGKATTSVVMPKAQRLLGAPVYAQALLVQFPTLTGLTNREVGIFTDL